MVSSPLKTQKFVRFPLLARVPLLLLALMPHAAFAVPSDPGSGCPAPSNTLVISEIMTGTSVDPRWIEITNPSAYTLSLAKVTLQLWGEKNELLSTFALGETLPSIQPGESWAMGAVPPTSPLGALLKLKVLDLGTNFPLPQCHGKISLVGPYGVVDAFAYDLCKSPSKPKSTVLALDPGFTDPCVNDDIKYWCEIGAKTSPYGSPGLSNPGCDLDADGYLSSGGDCNDLDPNIHPDAAEICNGKDDDCNKAIDDGIIPPAGFCPSLGICAPGIGKDGDKTGAFTHCEGKAGFVCDYPTGYESVKETLCDGFDNDCDGLTDEGLLNACGTCGALPPELCNGKDDNCNGATDEGVVETDFSCKKVGVCALAQVLCVDGTPTCVQDAAYEVTETTCDGLDNDCDGKIDEMVGDSQTCTVGVGACMAHGTPYCAVDGKVACKATPQPAGKELCGNGLDDNCDGQTDEGFDVGSQCEAGKGICRLIGKKLCSADKLGAVCSVEPGAPEAFEICANGLDDNCDGSTDETGCKTSVAPGAGCGAGQGGTTGGLALLGCAFVWAIWRKRRGYC